MGSRRCLPGVKERGESLSGSYNGGCLLRTNRNPSAPKCRDGPRNAAPPRT